MAGRARANIPQEAGGPSRDDPGAGGLRRYVWCEERNLLQPRSGGHQQFCLRGSAKQAV